MVLTEIGAMETVTRIDWLRRELGLRFQETQNLMDPGLLRLSVLLDRAIVQEQRRLAWTRSDAVESDGPLEMATESRRTG